MKRYITTEIDKSHNDGGVALTTNTSETQQIQEGHAVLGQTLVENTLFKGT